MKNEKNKLKQTDKNIIHFIDLKIEELVREVDEIQEIYQIDENVLEDYTKNVTLNESIKSSQNKAVKSNLKNLPKLEVTKKDKIINYKTPETLADSLKYEPNIKDLYTENEFEPTFKNLNELKTYPSIINCYDISDYVKYQNKEYSRKFIN